MCVFSLTGLVNFNASNFRVCVATCFGQVCLSCSLCIIYMYIATTILFERLHRVVLSTHFCHNE